MVLDSKRNRVDKGNLPSYTLYSIQTNCRDKIFTLSTPSFFNITKNLDRLYSSSTVNLVFCIVKKRLYYDGIKETIL